MTSWKRLLVVSLLFSLLSACDKKSGKDTTSPTPNPSPTPTPTPTPTPNRAPSITAINITPSFGISQLTSFTMGATATDADNDALTYVWDFGDGTQGSGANVTKTYNGSGTMTVQLAVSDGRNVLSAPPTATSIDSRSITVGGMTGVWRGRRDCGGSGNGEMELTLTQTAGVVTGTMRYLSSCGLSPAGTTAQTDPAQPGTINTSGAVELRIKVLAFTDYTMRGQMDTTGRRITGGVFGSGWNGNEFTIDKQ